MTRLNVHGVEYRFEPAATTVHVSEGEKANVRLVGTRHAFSCTGVVRHLNGVRMPGVTACFWSIVSRL